VENGVGVVFVNGFGVRALWVRGERDWRVRVGAWRLRGLGVHEHQRVSLKPPRHGEWSLRLRGRRDGPPFVWLGFGADVRRQGRPAVATM